MKDQVAQLLEDRKLLDEFAWLRKKVENLSSSILTLKNNDESNNNSYSNKMLPVDGSRFVEITIFNEFKNNTVSEFDNINASIRDMKKTIEEILLFLKSKASDKDLKNLEGKKYLLNHRLFNE